MLLVLKQAFPVPQSVVSLTNGNAANDIFRCVWMFLSQVFRYNIGTHAETHYD